MRGNHDRSRSFRKSRLRSRFRRWRGCRHSHRRNEAIAATQDVGDIGRRLGIVTERATERRHGLIYGVLGNHDVLPDGIEKVVDAHHLPGTAGEADEDGHGARLQLDDPAVSGDFVQRGVYPPVADSKSRVVRQVHRRCIQLRPRTSARQAQAVAVSPSTRPQPPFKPKSRRPQDLERTVPHSLA